MTKEDSRQSRSNGRGRRRPNTTTSGMLLASVAAPLGIVQGTTGSLLDAPRWLQASAAGVSLLLLLASFAVVYRPSLGQVSATLGILGTVGLGSPHLVVAPTAALTALIVGTSALVLLWIYYGALVFIVGGEVAYMYFVREGA